MKLSKIILDHRISLLVGGCLTASAATAALAYSARADVDQSLDELPEDATKIDKMKAVVPHILPAVGTFTIGAACAYALGHECSVLTKTVNDLSAAYSTTVLLKDVAERRVLSKEGPEGFKELRGDQAKAIEDSNLEGPFIRTDTGVYQTGHGDTLFISAFDGIMFRASKEWVLRCCCAMNNRILAYDEAYVSDLYSELEIDFPRVAWGGTAMCSFGWSTCYTNDHGRILLLELPEQFEKIIVGDEVAYVLDLRPKLLREF